MRQPWFVKGSLAASGSVYSDELINLVEARTLSVTVAGTCGSSLDADATCYLYFSPDGSNWDTIAYTSFDIAYTASTTVQRTVVVDVPEHGFMKAKVTNGSSADVITDIKVFYSIQSWGRKTGADRGDIRKDTGED